MAEERDRGYRLLFSHKPMVEWLIRRFVPGSWHAHLDFSRLHKVNERDLSPELLRREKDLLWRLPQVDDDGRELWFYVYLHFEFQSGIDRLMAVRETAYKSLLYLDLERQKLLSPDGDLPLVLSVVVYTGRKAWDAESSVRKLLRSLPGVPPSELPDGFLPDSYVVVDAQAYSSADLEQDENPVTALFQAEKSRSFEDLRNAVIKADELLPDSKYRVLRRDLARVFRDVLIPAKAPGTEIEEVDNLTEVATMLQESVIEWREGWVAEGEAKGRKEGEAKGRKEGEAMVLVRQAEKKFGPLPGWALARIESADADQLLTWAERILTARTLDEVFELADFSSSSSRSGK